MSQPKPNPAEIKLQKQLRNQRYRVNLIMREHNKEHDKLYRQKKREQKRLGLHQNFFTQLMNIITQ